MLARERLNVTELTGILGLAQSGVSRHLGLLKDAGLVDEEKDGGFSYYRCRRRCSDDGDNPLCAAARRRSSTASADDPVVRADDARLHEVLRLRKENFDAHGGPTPATRGSSCRAAAGPPGRARWACCCRR